jgi:hypothetical protein
VLAWWSEFHRKALGFRPRWEAHMSAESRRPTMGSRKVDIEALKSAPAEPLRWRKSSKDAYRRRCEIEDELAGVRRLLKRLELERLARLLEREIVLEGVARNLLPGTRRDDLLTEIDQLRALIKTLKPE